MTTSMLTKMFSNTISEEEMEFAENKLVNAENKERAHTPLKRFPRAAL
jgi:hypothetical protein